MQVIREGIRKIKERREGVKHTLPAEEKSEVPTSTMDTLHALKVAKKDFSSKEYLNIEQEVMYQHLEKHKAEFESGTINLEKFGLSAKTLSLVL